MKNHKFNCQAGGDYPCDCPESDIEDSIRKTKKEHISISNLFQSGEFKLHSGEISNFKIECDALTNDDWATLANIAASIIEPCKNVYGVPQGGFPLRDALLDYWYERKILPTYTNRFILIVDDVFTTGESMEVMRNSFSPYYHIDSIYGLVAFSRGKTPDWITPLFQLTLPK